MSTLDNFEPKIYPKILGFYLLERVKFASMGNGNTKYMSKLNKTIRGVKIKKKQNKYISNNIHWRLFLRMYLFVCLFAYS